MTKEINPLGDPDRIAALECAFEQKREWLNKTSDDLGFAGMSSLMGDGPCEVSEIIWPTIDSAPKNGKHVLGYEQSWYMPMIVYFREGAWRTWRSDKALNPTHWFPVADPYNRNI